MCWGCVTAVSRDIGLSNPGTSELWLLSSCFQCKSLPRIFITTRNVNWLPFISGTIFMDLWVRSLTIWKPRLSWEESQEYEVTHSFRHFLDPGLYSVCPSHPSLSASQNPSPSPQFHNPQEHIWDHHFPYIVIYNLCPLDTFSIWCSPVVTIYVCLLHIAIFEGLLLAINVWISHYVM